ncbi:Ganglioside-induced differentiation-associated-protein 2 [Nymphaea thermarum]|nr:Ganglioside-induced differentiation-associated-protein 2 [Nymphaea thermarum]
MESGGTRDGGGGGEDDEFSVMVLASDLTVDARSFLERVNETHQEDEWFDCRTSLLDEGFSDLEQLQALRVEGLDKQGRPLLRIVGKYFPAPVISAERLKKYVFHKIHTELPEGPFCIVYFHSCVQKEDNSPGMTILRCIYEDLPAAYKSRLEIVYFVHPGIRSRLVLATLGRFFLSEGLYWKIKYVSRLQYLWDDIKKGQVEIPDFVKQHDDVLENRPLTDYGIEPDILPVNEGPMVGYSFMRHEDRWASRAYS